MLSETTCWQLIEDAAGGDRSAREEFVRRYLPVVREYLAARWSSGPLRDQVDDATQEVFWQCLRPGGGIEQLPRIQRSFRGYLYGLVRNVARMSERKEVQRREETMGEAQGADMVAEQASLSRVFDRAWSRSLIHQAVDRQRHAATTPEAQRRIEMLCLRFYDNMPARDIATRLDLDPALVHRELSRARQDFRDALAAVLREHRGTDDLDLEREYRELLSLLQDM